MKININNPTAILGLDELFKSIWTIPSYPNEGIVILLKGKPGSGKTTLSLQILQRLINLSKKDINKEDNIEIEDFPEKIHYYSMEQSKEEINRRFEDIYIARLKYFFRSTKDLLTERVNDKNPNKADVKDYSDKIIRQNFNSKDIDVFGEILNKYNENNPPDPTLLEKEIKEELFKKDAIDQDTIQKVIIQEIDFDLLEKLISKLFTINKNKIESKLIEHIDEKDLENLKKSFCKSNYEQIKRIKESLFNTIKTDLNKLQFTQKGNLISEIKSQLFKSSNVEYQKIIDDHFNSNSKINAKEIEKIKDKYKTPSSDVIANDKIKHEWKKKFIEKKLFFLGLTKQLQIESRKEKGKDSFLYDSVMVWLNKRLNELDKIKQEGLTHKLIIVDGLNATSTDERKAFDYESMINRLKKLAAISIVVVEPTEADYSPVENFADIVIDLLFHKVDEPFEYITNQLIISKARHQFHFKGMHQYSIPAATSLLTVYPSDYFYLAKFSVHRGGQGTYGYGPFEMHKLKPKESYEDEWIEEEEDNSLLVKLLGKIRKGSNTIILGPRRTSKSLITLDFILSGYHPTLPENKTEENGLIVSLLDNYSAISKSPDCHRKACKTKKEKEGIRTCEICFEKISLFHLNPEVVSPNIFFYYLRKALDSFAIQNKPIKRLTFWDFTQMDITFPLLSGDKLFVSTLFKFLKYYKSPFRENKYDDKNDSITSVFFASPSCNLAEASLIADNVIYVWRDVEKDKDKKENLNEFQIVYVDRVEETTKTKSKEFYAFPIDNKINNPLNNFSKNISRKIKKSHWRNLEYTEGNIKVIEQIQGLK